MKKDKRKPISYKEIMCHKENALFEYMGEKNEPKPENKDEDAPKSTSTN